MNNQKTVKTTYRRLENILYTMGISYIETGKDWDGSTYWIYEDTAEVRLIATALKDIEVKLKTLKEGAAYVGE